MSPSRQANVGDYTLEHACELNYTRKTAVTEPDFRRYLEGKIGQSLVAG
jgi:hypothetical protein